MDSVVHGVARSRTRLSDFHFHLTVLTPPCLYHIAYTAVIYILLIVTKAVVVHIHNGILLSYKKKCI